ncbi:DUF4493 domain-containing protein [uncultured Bacteroides sp.]|uniref:DUF4493 domain-containing protein n=1 Tax=uncultured Bacteroides sp. TaxID=162156 RepID=UPI00261A264F|nr:DUF4493 domain-containing protein [uncultured Bacteroides sp.]
MKLKNTILYIAALSLFSCEMKNEILDGNNNYEDVGYLNLGVYAQNKLSKAATDNGEGTDNSPVNESAFQVEINNSEGVYKKFGSYSELQAAGKIELPVGKYTVKAHTPGDIQPKMSSPYYYGETALEIVKDVEKTATVNCKMKNTKIQLVYGETFATVFKSWSITVSDGSSNILTYDQSNPNPSAVYWLIADNVSEITVRIEACLQDGTKITEDRSITKPEDAESDYWAGSDALTITMEPGKPNPSGVTIDIKVEVSFTDSEVTEEIPVEPGDDNGDNPGGGDGDENPTITFPKNYYTLPDDENESADANIIASSGLKSVIVKITAGNSAFEEALSALPMAGKTDDEKAMLDLISGAELVGNKLLPQVIKLALSGVNIPELNKGAGRYEFPVGDFFTALKSLGSTGTDGKPSSHMFEITVEDMNGKSASGVLKVSVK